MIKNYFKIAIRNIIRNKVYSIINISGLAIGMCVFISIMTLILHELSYDQLIKDADDIYRVLRVAVENNEEAITPNTPFPTASTLKSEFPEILHATCIKLPFYISNNRGGYYRVFATDKEFFKVFLFDFIWGNPETALSSTSNVVITKDIALRLFGNTNPLGKTMSTVYGPLTVSGVVHRPGNTHINFGIVISIDLDREYIQSHDTWRDSYGVTYLKFRKNSDVEKVKRQLSDYLQKTKKKGAGALDVGFKLQPFKKVYLYSNYPIERMLTRKISFISKAAFIAFLILFIACINFINISISLIERRQIEAGIRKVLGADRKQLIFQFLGETVLISLISLIFALFFIEWTIPLIRTIANRKIDYWSVFTPEMILIITGMVFLTGIIAGIYPALYISSSSYSDAIKRKLKNIGRKARLRKILLVFQFSISIILIIVTFTINRQIHYLRKLDVGLDKKELIVTAFAPVKSMDFKEFIETVEKHPDISSVTTSAWFPYAALRSEEISTLKGDRTDQTIPFVFFLVDYNFIDTLKFKITEGRNFDRNNPEDATSTCLIDEIAVKVMGFKHPVGEYIRMVDDKLKIIGIVKNIPMVDDLKVIRPILLRIWQNPEDVNYFCARIKPDRLGNTREIIAFFNKKLEEFFPGQNLESVSLDDMMYYNVLVKLELVQSEGMTTFTVLAIIIACTGLFGLSSFTVEQRTKEIGIRKALGCSVTEVIRLLSKQWITLIFISNIIAWPIAYWITSMWLGQYMFHTQQEPWSYVLAGTAVMIVASFTFGFKTYKAASANPVKCLRYE